MHARYRNGYWPNSMGTRGQGTSSRILSEGSVRSHRNYSEGRNDKHSGFGRVGHSKVYQPAITSRGTDMFMEAGRLAAEYLVSKGVLPLDALSGKWQKDGLKNQMGEFMGFRPHNVDNHSLVPLDGHASVHARLGSTSLDVGPIGRRYFNENSALGSRNSVRERKRIGTVKNHGSELNRELGKGDYWGERSRASMGTEADNDASVKHRDWQPLRKDGDVDGRAQTVSSGTSPGTEADNDVSAKLRDGQPLMKDGDDFDGCKQTLSTEELSREGGTASHQESELEKHDTLEARDEKTSSSVNEKYLPLNAKEESTKIFDDANISSAEARMINEGMNDDALSKKFNENVEAKTTVREDTLLSNDIVNLMKHFKFAQIPTKPRSSLAVKGSKGDLAPMKQDGNITERGASVGSVVHILGIPDESSAGNSLSHQIHGLNSLDALKAPEVNMEMEVLNRTKPGECSNSVSYSETSGCKEDELDEKISAFGLPNSMVIDGGKKRGLDDDTNGGERFKKQRVWEPSESDGCLPLASLMEIQPTPGEATTSECMQASPSPDQNSLNISLFHKIQDESSEFMGQKLVFPGSFKTCDLNLVGTCDVQENHHGGQKFSFSSIVQTGKELEPVDVGLSMSNSCNVPNKTAKVGVNNNEIEVIDLENDSAQEDQTFSYPERRPDSVFTDMDEFPNNVNNVHEIPDVQGGYGLMFSELLGNDSPNCSSVPAGLNSLHNTMEFSNTEGILGDDDSIYMSLDEIPISFLGNWGPPTQDYGKPF